MAADLNRVTLVGRLTRDPELRQTAGGTSVCGIRLASTSRTKRGEQWEDQSNYFDVTVFGRQAETAQQYLAKGRRIGVDGRLRWREYETKDGSKRQVIDVAADDVQMLDTRAESQQRPAGSDMPVDNPAPAADDTSDIPF